MIAFGLRCGAALLVAAWAIATPPTLAQIKTDGSVGPRRALKGPDFRIDEQLGKRVGKNLFHSFEEFNIRTLGDGTIERATFRGANDIAHVISRVTGASPSEINGLLRSEVGKADLWFINPNGVAFGPNARLDVPGSFHVSTADQLRLADGAAFSAADPDASTLTVAPPEAFGFLGDSAADILVSGSRLEIPDRETLSLSSGRIDIRNAAEVRAAEGRVLLTTQAGAGEVRASSGRPSTPPSGTIEIATAVVDTSGDGGGDLRVNTGRLTVDNATLAASNTGNSNRTNGIRITADSVSIVNDSALGTEALSSGKAGGIVIRAEHLLITTGAFLTASTSDAGAAGPIHIDVDKAKITGGTSQNNSEPGGVFSNASLGSGGDAGDIRVSAGDLEIIDGGVISGSSSGAGNGGRISVDVDNRLVMSGRSVAREKRRGFDSADPDAGIRSGIISQIEKESTATSGGTIRVHADVLKVADEAVIRSITRSEADAGSVRIEGNRVLVRSGGQISSSSFARGDSGEVTVRARDALGIRGKSATTNDLSDLPAFREPSGVFVSTESLGAKSGKGGRVRISASTIALGELGKISSETFGGGRGGAVEIARPRLLTIDGEAQITSATTGAGRAGDLAIRAGEVMIGSGGRIDASSVARGQPGTIRIAADRITIVGDPDPDINATGVRSEIGSRSTAVAAGRIEIDALELRLLDGGEIRTSSFGDGDAGKVRVAVERRLLLTGRSVERHKRRDLDSEDGAGLRSSISSKIEDGSDAPTGGNVRVQANVLEVSDEAVITSATRESGNAGSVKISADQIVLRTGGQISSSTFAGGNSGKVTVKARNTLAISGESATISRTDGRPEPSGIFGSAESQEANAGNGGDVEVSARVIALRDRGEISSETFKDGDGGKIAIAAADTLVLTNAEITAVSTAATGGGDAGDIEIRDTRVLELRNGALIRTQAESADGGDITIEVNELIDLAESAITTEVGEVGGRGGDGGNIRIDPRFLVLDRSAINASAAEESAGDITIVADNLIRSAGSEIEATGGPAGIDGRIVLETVEADLVGDLAELPATFLVSERLFDQGCAARSGQPVSSLQRSGRGGLSQMPDAPLGAVLLADKLPDAPDRAVRAGKTEGPLDPVLTSGFLDCGW